MTPDTNAPPIPAGETPARREHPLRKWRVRENVSQARIARDLGVPVETIYAWEAGRRSPGPEGMEALIDRTGLRTLPTLWHRWAISLARGEYDEETTE